MMLDLLLRLDSRVQPGLPSAKFKSIFAMCHCGQVTTRRVFGDHVCAVAVADVVRHPHTIIDLTSDDSESDNSDPSEAE